jgi:trehalose-6-phosphate synthase
LMAIDKFLEDNPRWRGKVAFSMVGITAMERADDYHQTLMEVKERVGAINSKWGNGEIVVYFEERREKELNLVKRLGFFAGSDILLITPIRLVDWIHFRSSMD